MGLILQIKSITIIWCKQNENELCGLGLKLLHACGDLMNAKIDVRWVKRSEKYENNHGCGRTSHTHNSHDCSPVRDPQNM